jgi:OmpA-OmpF porin, OOP family
LLTETSAKTTLPAPREPFTRGDDALASQAAFRLPKTKWKVLMKKANNGIRRSMPWLAASGIALAAFGASAQTMPDSGWSIGGSLGSSHWKGSDLGGIANDPSDTGLKAYGGYWFGPTFGLEGGYVNLGKFKGPNGNLKSDGAFFDAVGKIPLSGTNFSVLGRVGLYNGSLKFDKFGLTESDRGTNFKVGLGAQYDFDPRLGMRAEWERYRLDTNNIKANTDMYSVGVNYRF